MAAPKIDDLLALDVESRLELIQRLWDSVVDEARNDDALPLSPAERELLEDRLREDDATPGAAVPWIDVRRDLRGE